MTAPAPLVVFDVNDRPAFDRIIAAPEHHQRLLDWMRSQGLDPHDVYRLEVFLVDCPSARVFEYARDGQGRGYCGVDHDHRADLDCCHLARRDPYEVPLSSLPPMTNPQVAEMPPADSRHSRAIGDAP